MAVDLSPIDADLLKTLTNVHGIPEVLTTFVKMVNFLRVTIQPILKLLPKQTIPALIFLSRTVPKASASTFLLLFQKQD